jgi:FtsP/CotA-like multicopper oxidase with cupredoxin domain
VSTQPALSRRTLLAGAGGAALSLVLARCGGSSSGSAKPSTESVDGWVQPITRRSSGGELSTTLRASEGPVLIGTKDARALTYEQMYPGPTLEVRPGDRLKVDLINDTGQITNLHTHGLHVTPNSPGDNVLLRLAPGETFHYAYDIPDDHPAGTLWYHAHFHPKTDNQVSAGLFGTLVVRGEFDDLPGIADAPERVMVFSQAQIKDGAVAEADTSPLATQSTLVNGRYQPSFEIVPGHLQRWRLLNASVVFLRLRLDGHLMHPVAIDGNAMTKPASKRILEIPPGGRADILVRADRAGTFFLRSLSWAPLGAFYQSMVPLPQPVVRVESRGRPASPRQSLPQTLLPVEDLRDAKIDRRRSFRLEEIEPGSADGLDKFHYYINGRLFDHHRVDETMVLGATEEWEFVNMTYEPHPFHIHINPFQVVAINGKPVYEGHFRDTAMIPPFGTLTIRHRFLDYTGTYVWHCHILFHEDHGMMQLLNVVKDGQPSGFAPARGGIGAPGHATAANTGAYLCELNLA